MRPHDATRLAWSLFASTAALLIAMTLLSTVRETIQPEHVTLWLREPEKP